MAVEITRYPLLYRNTSIMYVDLDAPPILMCVDSFEVFGDVSTDNSIKDYAILLHTNTPKHCTAAR
jgi:hypothetical protein